MAEGERRRLRPFPGVQLEFGRDGVSTTVSERIAAGKGLYGGLRSSGVGELQRILEAAALRHADLSREIAEQERVLAGVRRRLWLAQFFVARLVTVARVRRLVEQGQSSIYALALDRAEREAGKVEVHFATDTATVAAYVALTRAFEVLAGNDRIWDVSATSPDGEVEWAPLSFSVGPSDIVACGEDVLVAPRGSGGSLQILPGFVLLRGASEAIVLEHGGVELDVTPARFLVENKDLPRDAKIVGQALPPESADQKGKAANAPLPIVEYGTMTVQTTDRSLTAQAAQLPVYVFSTFAKARVFVEAYDDYKRTLAAVTDPEPQQAVERAHAGVVPQEPPLDIRPRRELWLDWAAIALIVFLLWLPFVLSRPLPSSPAAPFAKPIAAAARPSEAKRTKATGRVSAPAARRPKRANGQAIAASQEEGEPCGLVRQPTGALKIVPCAAAGGASAGPP